MGTKTDEINEKQKGGRSQPNHINKHIKYKQSKHPQLKSRLPDWKKQANKQTNQNVDCL